MEVFVKSKVNDLISPLQIPRTENINNRRRLNPLRLASFCHKDPVLAEEIPKCISGNLWGINFRAASEWFDLLTKQTIKNGVKKTLAKVVWLGRTYARDVNYIKNEDNSSDAQTGWKIVCLVVAARRPAMPPEDLNTALAALRWPRSLPESDDDRMEVKTMLRLARGTISCDPEGNLRSDYAFYDCLRSEAAADTLRETHSNMAEACVHYLNLKLPQLPRSYKYRSNTAYWNEPFLGYATAFWGDHLRLAGQNLAPEVSEVVMILLENTDSMEAYIKAAWISNLRHEAPLQWDVSSGIHALHVCAWFNLSSLIQRICKNTTVDRLEATFGQTPLMYACRKGHVEAATTLLELGANPALFSKRGHSALIEAVTVHESTREYLQRKMRIVEMLLQDHRVLVNESHPLCRHRTALHTAVLKGHDKIVNQLLNFSASPNCFDDRDFTPLMYAARDGKLEMVKSLLNHGASPDVYGPKWRFRTTALHLVTEKYPHEPKYEGERAETYRNIANSLIAHKAHPGMRDVWGLDVVAKSRRRKLDISHLWPETEPLPGKVESCTFDMVFSEPQPDRILDLAVSTRDVRQVEMILRENASLARTKDRYGRTPLHLAVNTCNMHLGSSEEKHMEKDSRIIVALLTAHSNMSATDKWGLAAMDYALYHRDTLTQIELLEKGAKLDPKRHDALSLLLEYAYRDQKSRAAGTLLRLGADMLEAYSLILRHGYPTISFDDLQQYEYHT